MTWLSVGCSFSRSSILSRPMDTGTLLMWSAPSILLCAGFLRDWAHRGYPRPLGANRIFTSPFALCVCGEDGVTVVWRPTLCNRVRGSRSWSLRAWLWGERARFGPSRHPLPHHLLSLPPPPPGLETLAAALCFPLSPIAGEDHRKALTTAIYRYVPVE
jgi:hypothetical protein